MAKPDLAYVGIRGSVVAMDRISGGRAWETKPKGSGFVTLLVDDGQVLAGTQGEVFCLNAVTGEILWHDGLQGYGFSLMSLATQNGHSHPAIAAAEQKRREADSSAAAATTTAG